MNKQHSSKSFKSPVQFFSSLTRNTTPPRVWFAILSHPKQSSSYLVDIILMFLEYLQLCTQAINTNQPIYADPTSTSISNILSIVSGICSTLQPGQSIRYSANQRGLAVCIFIILVSITLLKYALFAYIVVLSFKRSYGSKWLLRIWRLVFGLQGRVLCHFVGSIWFSYVRAGYQGQLGFDQRFNLGLMVFPESMIFLEFLFSFILLTQFTYSIPRKNLVTAKNQYTEAITLSQKGINQFLKLCFMSNPYQSAWIRTLISLGCCLIRNFYYFANFPHYKLKAALYQSSFLMAVTGLNLAFLLHVLLKSVYDSQLNPSFWMIAWIIITVLLVLPCRRYVKDKWLSLVLLNANDKKPMLIHQVLFIKNILKFKLETNRCIERYSSSYLISMATSDKFKYMFDIKEGMSLTDRKELGSKENIKKFMMNYLQELMNKYPNDDLIKLYVGYYQAQKLKLYGNSMRILQELKCSSKASIALSAHFLAHSLQESLIANYKHKVNKLDLYTYIQNLSICAQLKEEIFSQAELQASLYKSFIKNSQNLYEIYELAQKVNLQRRKVEKKISRSLEAISEYYIEPIMLCAHYYFILNHSLHQYLAYGKMYNQRYKKYEKVFLNDQICQENLLYKYDQLIFFSGNKREPGIVKYMSKSLQKTCGKTIVDHHHCNIVPERYREDMYKAINMIVEQGDLTLLDSTASSFVYNFQEDNWVPIDFYGNISPFLYQGLHFLLAARLPPKAKEFIIIEENGDIMGFTKLIGQKLGLFEYRKQLTPGTEMNIKQISKKLAQANHAINTTLYPGKYSNTSALSDDDAKDISSTFMNRGENLKLNSFQAQKGNKEKWYSYHCKFESRPVGPRMMRAIALKKVQDFEAIHKDDNDSINTYQETEIAFSERLNREENYEESVISEGLNPIASDKEEDDFENILTVTKGNSATTPILRARKYKKIKIQNLTRKDSNQCFTDQDNLSSSRKLLTPRNFGAPAGMSRWMATTVQNVNPPVAATVIKHQEDNHAYGSVSGMSKRNKYQSVQTKLSKDYHKAIYTKYYPYYYRILILFVYSAFIVILACQISFKGSFEREIQILDVRKNVAELVMNRTDLLTIIYGQTRTLWMYGVGQQNLSSYPATSSISSLFSRMRTSLSQLGTINKDIITAMDYLDAQSRERLFEKNVRIFYTKNNTDGNFINMTTFQAIDKMIETNLQTLTLGSINLQETILDFEIYMINSMNDLLVESEFLARFLSNSIRGQKDVILERSSVNFNVSTSLLIITFISFCVVVSKQYQKEKKNMQAVARLDTNGVVDLIDKVNNFQTMLQDETKFEELPGLNTYISSKKKMERSNPLNEKSKMNTFTQKSNAQGLSRKYQWYPCLFVISLLLIIGLIVAKLYITSSSTSEITYIFNQIYFTGTARPRMRLSSLITVNLLSESDILIRNSPLLIQLDKEITFLQKATHNISEVLKKRDSSYDPIIQNVIFSNACQYMTTPYMSHNCQLMSKNLTTSGLITFMTDYQSTLSDFKVQYKSSNKSSSDLEILAQTTFTVRIPPSAVMDQLMAVISIQLEMSFSQMIENATKYSTLTSRLLFVFLALISFWLHVGVINRVKEAENGFRTVLKVFPPRLVLSNFMLKSYLNQTWKGTLDSAQIFNKD